mgnify:FL=1
MMPQKILSILGGRLSPEQSIVQIMRVAESDEVTNHDAIKTVVKKAISHVAQSTLSSS